MSISPSKFITIVGPTASGKTDLALSLAEQFGGEIICADSRTVYRGLDIGTAKPSAQEQARVPHHLLDVVDPGETLSVAAFKALAEATLIEIAARGHVPMLVGGSGLYVDAVLFDYQFPGAADPDRRRQLEALGDDELRELLAAEDSLAYLSIDIRNRRRLIRAIETAGQQRQRRPVARAESLVLGLRLNKEVMQKRIEQRVEKMLERGFLDEVRRIGATYGWDCEALSGIGYRAFKEVILGTKTMAAAKADFIRGDMLLMKRQLTWFKRNPGIVWLDDPRAAPVLVEQFLAKSTL